MPFRCPECLVPESLEIILKIELPPDSHAAEIALQIVECSKCGFAGIAVYKETRQGDLGLEPFVHIGYRVSEDCLNRFKRTVEQCPEPNNRRCKCSAHSWLSQKDVNGRWSTVDDFPREGAFELINLGDRGCPDYGW